jgi:hypothetical protein
LPPQAYISYFSSSCATDDGEKALCVQRYTIQNHSVPIYHELGRVVRIKIRIGSSGWWRFVGMKSNFQ